MLKNLRTSMLCLMTASTLSLLAQDAPAHGPAAAHRPAAAPAPSSWLWSRMADDLTRLAGKVDGRVGMFLRSLDTGETFSLRGDEVFPAASTIKLALLLELYRQSEGGQGMARLSDEYLLRPQDLVADSSILGNLAAGTRLTNRDLALFTVVVSDNSATNILIDRVGMDRVNATLAGLGLRNTRLRRKMMDVLAAREGRENHATPRELVALLAAIQGGPSLNRESRADLLHLLGTPKDGFLTRLLPEDLPVANKPGTLPGVRNDAGIIYVKGRPFLIAVMTSHLRDEREGEEVIARIARRAAECLEVAGAASPDGRIFSALHVR